MVVTWVEYKGEKRKERIVCYSSQEEGHATPPRGERRTEAPGSVRRPRSVGRAWTKVFIVVFVGRDGKGRVSSGASLGRGSWKNFRRLWASGMVLSYPVPGLEVIWGQRIMSWTDKA